jgi:hypothetical protein
VLVEEVDAVGLESLQHPFGRGLDVVGAAFQAATAFSRLEVDVPAELRGYHDLIADWRQRFAD